MPTPTQGMHTFWAVCPSPGACAAVSSFRLPCSVATGRVAWSACAAAGTRRSFPPAGSCTAARSLSTVACDGALPSSVPRCIPYLGLPLLLCWLPGLPVRSRTGPEEASREEALPAGFVSNTRLVLQLKSVFTCKGTPSLHPYRSHLSLTMFDGSGCDMQYGLEAISLMQLRA